ncbi:SRPBCC family protein [Gluconobacter sp. LMG 1744]|uniref:Polyketide cyclase n=1 Tax=Gluconobacter cerinus TaxID=38307 RepID=A0A1B6VG20_9PROT|nr:MULTISPECIES: SRPBCC family protein [Gluconobacter]OAG73430.1 polyketide cyclase [Gluconobacter japonicus]AQS89873.1 polyketide cyclase [Gluconobacter albidus]AQS92366.1 polyketide cyclase [Gluconobacter albidus]MBF0891676.1 SRPBCC family protein [Gluconobacter cadivus]MBS1020367.1 SRPBCC family protein [Gluconobacter cerinus]
MIHVMASSIIPASLPSVWRLVRNFGALGRWLPGVRSCAIEGNESGDRVGAIRLVEMGDVGLIREQLLALSDVDHAVTFSIVESALPVRNYRSTISLLPITKSDHTFIQWRGQFEAPAEHAASMEARMPTQIYQPAFDRLAEILASETTLS